MATKKPGLPEININAGPMVDAAHSACDAHAQVAEYTTLEKQYAEEISKLAVQKRVEEVGRGNYVGLIRVTGDNLPPVRVEMRMENGALSIDEEANLEAIYGPSRPLLFQKEKVVNEIVNPQALIAELIAAGKNPFDFLDLTVKKGLDAAIVDSNFVTSGEAFLPKEGFLNTVNEIKKTLSADAITYTNNFLQSALKPRVVLGTKGKA